MEQDDVIAGLPEDLRRSVPVWTVRTKADLETLPEQDSSGTIQEIACSSKSAEGMNPLFSRLTRFAEETISVGEAPLATRERHRHYLKDCLSGLRAAVDMVHLRRNCARKTFAELRMLSDGSPGGSMSRICSM